MPTEPAEHDEETIVERIGKGLGIDPDGDRHDPLDGLLVKVNWRPSTRDFDLLVAGDAGNPGPTPGDACTDDDVFFTAVNVRAPPNAPGTAEEWYRRARQALTGPKSDAHRYFTFTLNRTSGPSPEATFKWSWHEPTTRADPMPALIHDAQKGTKRIGVAKMRAQPFTRSDRQMFGEFLFLLQTRMGNHSDAVFCLRLTGSFAAAQLERAHTRLTQLTRENDSLRSTLTVANKDLRRAVEFKEAERRDGMRRFAVLLNSQKVRLRAQSELLDAARVQNDDMRARMETNEEGTLGMDGMEPDGGESELDTDEEEEAAARRGALRANTQTKIPNSKPNSKAASPVVKAAKRKGPTSVDDGAPAAGRATSSQPSQKSMRSDKAEKGAAGFNRQNSVFLDDIFESVGIQSQQVNTTSQTLGGASARLAGTLGAGTGSQLGGGSRPSSRRTSAAAGGGGGGGGRGRGRGRPRQAGGKNPLEDINSLLGGDGV